MKTFARLGKILTLSFFSVFLFSELSAQVTIGMGEAPAKAGLLQIKDQAPDQANVTSQRGGLILPRVSLVNLQTLEPFVSLSDADYEAEKTLNVGLIVYNMTRSGNIIPGLYFWDGSSWNILKATNTPSSSGNPQIIDIGGKILMPETDTPTSVTNPTGLTLSNSYIVPAGKTIIFPVMKAYAAWVQLLNLSEIDLAGSVTTELLWQDANNLISSVSLSDGDKGSASQIKVVTNDSNIEGNAVIVVKINNVIRWSWHIWVTSYDPSLAANQRTYNSKTLMDRNLGATNTLSGNIGSFGLFYQWGRKDPFIGSGAIASNVEHVLYSITGTTVNITKTPVAQSSNLATAVKNPLTYYYAGGGNTDWYSNAGGSNKNDNLWNNTDGTKTVYDPCPKGWRVPGGTTSVWSNLSPGTMGAGTGMTWSAGFFPAAGCRSEDSGALISVGSMGYVWTAIPIYWSNVVTFRFADNSTGNEPKNRSLGSSVRCVAE